MIKIVVAPRIQNPDLLSRFGPVSYDQSRDSVTARVAQFVSVHGGMPMATDLGTVEDRSFCTANFRLQNGDVIPMAKIVYETYGRLAPDGRNAVLITHGYTSSHHAASRNPANGNLPGWVDRSR